MSVSYTHLVEDGKVESVEFDSYQINITPVSENKNSYLQEQTYYCGRLDDPDLLPLLKDKGITISRVIPDNTSTWIYNILSFLLPLVLIWILMGVLMKRMGCLLYTSFNAIFLLMAISINRNVRLQQENQLLSMQQQRYESLKAAIEETRQARHDLRHQLCQLAALAEEGNLEKIKEMCIRDSYDCVA